MDENSSIIEILGHGFERKSNIDFSLSTQFFQNIFLFFWKVIERGIILPNMSFFGG